MYYEQEQDQLATHSDAMREYTWNVGAENPNQAWILTNYDVWMKNPYYHGPAVQHPEDERIYDQ